MNIFPQNQMDNSYPPWEDLPQELISAIANFLITNPNPNFLDIYSFRSVCNSWRSSFPPFSNPSILSPILPITTIPPPSSIYNRSSSSPHCSPTPLLSITVVYSLRPKIIQSSNGFVLFVDEFECGKLKIRRPFTRRSYSVPIFFPVKVNLFDFHAHEIGRFCNLSYCYYYDDEQGVRVTKPRFRSENVVKVVLFCDGSAAVGLFDGGKLGLIRLGLGVNVVGLCRNSDSQWDVIHDGKGFQFDDIVDYKGRVLGVDRGGKVYEIGRSSSEIDLVVRSTSSIARGSGRRKRLVESLGALYLVVRCYIGDERNGNSTFKVYELNFERRKWVEINSIGDRVFFFGLEFSFSASAQEVSCGKNSILFKQNSFKPYRGDLFDDDEVFCHSKLDSLYVGVCHLDAAAHVGAIESYNGYLDTLWPPPAWIWPIDRLGRLATVDAAFDEIFMKIYKKFKTKFSELTVEGGGTVSYDDFQKADSPRAEIINDFIINCTKGVDIWSTLQRLKELINKMKVAEEKLIRLEESLHPTLSLDGYSVSMDLLSKMEGSPVSETLKEKLDCRAEIQCAIKNPTTDHGCDLNKIRDMLVSQNRMIFQIEERASNLVCQYYLCQSSAEESSSTHSISNT